MYIDSTCTSKTLCLTSQPKTKLFALPATIYLLNPPSAVHDGHDFHQESTDHAKNHKIRRSTRLFRQDENPLNHHDVYPQRRLESPIPSQI